MTKDELIALGEQVGLQHKVMLDDSSRDVDVFVTKYDGSVPSIQVWERFYTLSRADLVAENERLERALKDASVAAIAEALEVDALRAELSALRAGGGL